MFLKEWSRRESNPRPRRFQMVRYVDFLRMPLQARSPVSPGCLASMVFRALSKGPLQSAARLAYTCLGSTTPQSDAGPVGPELHHAAMRSLVMKPLLLLAIELRGAGKSAPTLQRVLPFSRPVETVSAPWLPRSSNRW